MRQYDCEPTLNDTEVLEFCKNGFMMFEGVVSEELNRRTNEYLDEHDGTWSRPRYWTRTGSWTA